MTDVSTLSEARMIGLADPVGLKMGFLIPVFHHYSTNALLTERVASDDTVDGYEVLEQEIPRIDCPQLVSSVGNRAYWAFGLGDGQALVGQGDQNRDALAAHLDAILKDRPLLGLEVVQFLGLEDRRVEFEERAFARLSANASAVAANWRDISVLTPDLRSHLHESLRKETPSRRQWIDRLVLRLSSRGAEIWGINEQAYRRYHEVLVSDTFAVLDRHSAIAQPPLDGWNLILPTLEEPRLDKRRVLVLVADAGRWNNRFQERNPDLEVFPPDRADDFFRRSSSTKRRAFVLDSLGRNPDFETKAIRSGRPPIALLTRSRSSSGLLAEERRALLEYPLPVVLLGSRTSSPFSQSTLPSEARDAIDLLSTDVLPLHRKEAQLFVRARGTGSHRLADAWTQIYERVWRFGLDPTRGSAFEVHRSDHDADDQDVARILFPRVERHYADLPADAQRRAPEVSLLLDIGPDVEETRDQTHAMIVAALLERKGWRINPRKVTRRPEPSLSIEGREASFLVRIDTGEEARSVSYNMGQLLLRDFGEVRTILATENATPGAILTSLFDQNELRATVRDLYEFESSQTSWSLIGAQIKRFANSLSSRTRSHYFALLCESALRREPADFAGAKRLRSEIHSPEFGDRTNLVCSRVRSEDGIHSVRLNLIENGANRSWPSSRRDTPPFELLVSAHGPRLRPVD